MQSGSTKVKIVLALHAHLPYVRNPEEKFPMQELWLHHAITECYIPLILCFRELVNNNINFNITLSFSPTLLCMLSDDYYKTKYRDYLRTIGELLEKKISVCRDTELKEALLFLSHRIEKTSEFYNEIQGDIINQFSQLKGSGLNLITTAATHALLPLLRFSPGLIQSQIDIGQKTFGKKFGFIPDGFWLPEMGYFADLDKILRKFDIKYTFLEAHSVFLGNQRPSYGNFYPSVTGAGLKIFPRDLPLSNAIWSANKGYPGHPAYREFHYDYTFSLNKKELAEYGVDKIPFGLKIYRISGNEQPKKYYNYKTAIETVEQDSDDFIKRIRERTLVIQKHINRTPVLTLPFDAELFGHWWYEGPEFLKQVITKIANSGDIEIVSPSQVEDNFSEQIKPAESSWGREGFFTSWTNPECTWIYPVLADLDSRYNELEIKNNATSSQALKEILLASSSDWTFLIANDTSADYAKMRLKDHLSSAGKIINSIEAGKTDEQYILKRNELYPVFKGII